MKKVTNFLGSLIVIGSVCFCISNSVYAVTSGICGKQDYTQTRFPSCNKNSVRCLQSLEATAGNDCVQFCRTAGCNNPANSAAYLITSGNQTSLYCKCGG